MKKFDIVWSKGRVRFNDINVPGRDVEEAIAVVRAKHGAWMVESVVSVTEYVPPYESGDAFRMQRNHDMGDAVRAYLGMKS